VTTLRPAFRVVRFRAERTFSEATIRERLQQLRMNNSDGDTNQRAEEQALMEKLNVIRIIL